MGTLKEGFFSRFCVISFLMLFLCSSFLLVGCGTNIFEGFVDQEESLGNLLDDASSVEDYRDILEKTSSIIESSSSSDAEKSDAFFVQAEALLGVNEVSSLDLFGELSTAADAASSNPLSVLDIDTSNVDLIKASESIASANSLGGTGSPDQNLLKGVVNTMVVVNTVQETFDVQEDGTLVQKNNESYWDSLDSLMNPAGSSSDQTLKDFSDDAFSGFNNSGSMTSEQLEEVKSVNTAITESSALYKAVKEGGVYNGKTYAGIVGDAAPTSAEVAMIEDQLSSIFKDF
ncbi:hypothetical protein DID78_00365 [Candidatus Marinamargulisbacteria bacterium SCGC AG-343-D04]|nr:hypothetical protein DID78_00365 [Candidatus Marinamargulisbacteria bacterium SCGC AG-343-D04]